MSCPNLIDSQYTRIDILFQRKHFLAMSSCLGKSRSADVQAVFDSLVRYGLRPMENIVLLQARCELCVPPPPNFLYLTLQYSIQRLRSSALYNDVPDLAERALDTLQFWCNLDRTILRRNKLNFFDCVNICCRDEAQKEAVKAFLVDPTKLSAEELASLLVGYRRVVQNEPKGSNFVSEDIIDIVKQRLSVAAEPSMRV
jgi:hypothetical protein